MLHFTDQSLPEPPGSKIGGVLFLQNHMPVVRNRKNSGVKR